MKIIYRLSPLALFIGMCLTSYGQITLTTKLGYDLLLQNDGSVQIIQANKNNPTNSPFEKPKPYLELDVANKTKLLQLEHYCIERDTASTLELYRYNKSLTYLRNLKEQGNATQGNQKQITEELNAVTQKVAQINASYNRILDLCTQALSLREEASEKKLLSEIDRLYNVVFTIPDDKEITESKAIKFKTPAVDERKPWEIKHVGDTTKQVSLFTYTPENLKNYYKGNFLLEVFPNQLSKKMLELTFVFNSGDVAKSYGVIARGSMLKIDFIHGASIVLKAAKNIEPSIETYTGNTIYKAQYIVKSKDEYKKLKSSSLENIGVMWTSGFELYPVYNIDYFKNL